MRSFFEDLGRKIGNTAETVTNKAGEVMEIQRLRNQIRALEYSNEKAYMELGRMLYERFKAGEMLTEQVSCICEAICTREKSMSKYEGQICQAKGHIKCCGCGKFIEKEMSYCPYCGGKVSESQGSDAVDDGEYADGTDSAEYVEREDSVEHVECEVCREDIKDRVADMAEKFMKRADSAADNVKDKSQDVAETIKEKAVHVSGAVKEKVKEMEENIKSMTEK